jgi:hypothetical protein
LEKGGWLTKQGHKVKNWKRRWFVLKDPTLAYYVKPRDTTPAGVIILDDILTIVSEKNIYEENRSAAGNPQEKLSNWFEIITKKNSYLITADSEDEMREWVEAIEFVIGQREVMNVNGKGCTRGLLMFFFCRNTFPLFPSSSLVLPNDYPLR